MEAPPGFEPGNKGFADLCLTAWLWCHIKYYFFEWSGLRGSNSLPPPWQGGALPDELNPHTSNVTYTIIADMKYVVKHFFKK